MTENALLKKMIVDLEEVLCADIPETIAMKEAIAEKEMNEENKARPLENAMVFHKNAPVALTNPIARHKSLRLLSKLISLNHNNLLHNRLCNRLSLILHLLLRNPWKRCFLPMLRRLALRPVRNRIPVVSLWWKQTNNT